MDPSSHSDRYASRTDITEEDSGYLPPDSPVDKAVVLRAVAFDAAGNSSNITTATYFIDFDQKDGYENAAVLKPVSTSAAPCMMTPWKPDSFTTAFHGPI